MCEHTSINIHICIYKCLCIHSGVKSENINFTSTSLQLKMAMLPLVFQNFIQWDLYFQNSLTCQEFVKSSKT